MTAPVQRYLSRLEVLAHRATATERRLEQMAAAARDAWETRLADDQPHRCAGCGAWVPVGGACRTGCAR